MAKASGKAQKPMRDGHAHQPLLDERIPLPTSIVSVVPR